MIDTDDGSSVATNTEQEPNKESKVSFNLSKDLITIQTKSHKNLPLVSEKTNGSIDINKS